MTESNTNSTFILFCGECESTDISTEYFNYEFLYGTGKNAAKLSAVIPVRVCKSCGAEFLDYESEQIIDDVIKEWISSDIHGCIDTFEKARARLKKIEKQVAAKYNIEKPIHRNIIKMYSANTLNEEDELIRDWAESYSWFRSYIFDTADT